MTFAVSLGRDHFTQFSAERDDMESPIVNELSAIQYHDTTLYAAVCQRCGTKIYPAGELDAHMDRHQIKDLYLEGELKRLQYAMGRMR